MSPKLLVTGSSGLIGRRLLFKLAMLGYETRAFDIRETGVRFGNICDKNQIIQAIKGCDGIVHLAAISRVGEAERQPSLCWNTNVAGLDNVIEAALEQDQPPWVLFASSREVYGLPSDLPATELTPVQPVNVYGRSKVEGEYLLREAQKRGLKMGILRLSNVYGDTKDYPDRVVPAFARRAILGEVLRVEGGDNTLDFTHVHDIAGGFVQMIKVMMSENGAIAPINLATGEATLLAGLADLAINLAQTNATIQIVPPRVNGVTRFVGCSERARKQLGWVPEVAIREGLVRLINDFRLETSLNENR